jgi:integration host factor subunit alpha
MTLTKAEIALKIGENCGFMRQEAAEIVEKLVEIMKSSLIAGDDIMISGFGKWSVKQKHARRGRNPQTGEAIIIEPRRVVTWSYSPGLKKSCNSSVEK